MGIIKDGSPDRIYPRGLPPETAARAFEYATAAKELVMAKCPTHGTPLHHIRTRISSAWACLRCWPTTGSPRATKELVMAHTPIPWTVQPSAHRSINIVALDVEPQQNIAAMVVLDVPGKANAEFIVRAVNSHSALLEALEGLVNQETAHLKAWNIIEHPGDNPALEQARTAIDQATT